MRIVAGTHRGRRITAPLGPDIRPTADRVREALFNMLEHGGFGSPHAEDGDSEDGGSVIAGARVVDAFCGTGALAFEALSRGALAASLLDRSEKALAAVRETARALGESGRVHAMRRDATAPGPPPMVHDLAFLDPPYGSGLALPALTALAAQGWLTPAAVAVVELSAEEAVPPLPPEADLLRERRYGATRVLVLRWTTG